MHEKALELYNTSLGTYFDEYHGFLYSLINKMDDKFEPDKLFLETYDYDAWFEELEN